MRIFYDHQVFSLQDKGGISRYFFELIRHLGDVHSVQADIFAGANRSAYRFASAEGVRAWEYQSPLVMMPRKFRYIMNECAENLLAILQCHYDVYHPTLYRWAPMVRYEKMVVTHHDCAYERFPLLFRNADAIRKMRARQFARADTIICPSQSTRSDLHDFYDVPESKTIVIHHGITKLPAPPRESTYPKDRPFLLYVGSRAAYKNFPQFLKAYAAAGLGREFNILVLGATAATAAERELVESLSISKQVKFMPSASDEDLARAYQMAHLLVYPSLYEGFGFPPLEAMSFGCPVLVAQTSSLPEICGEVAFYFEPADKASFMNSLKTACFDEQERIRRSQLGKIIASTFNWQQTTKKTLDVYSA